MDGIFTHIAAVQQRVAEIETKLDRLNGAPAGRSAVVAQRTYPAPSFPGLVEQHLGTSPTPPAELDPLIARAAAQYQLRPSLLRALIQAESNYNPRAVSPAGAQGLTQLMPGTAAGLGVTDPFDPAQNIFGGARYLRQQLDAFQGDERLALAAYNAGPGAVRRYHGIPPYPETQHYVTRVLALAGEDE